MEKYATGEIKKEHGGKTYSFPFRVKAENVEESDEKRFTSDTEIDGIKEELNNKPDVTDPVNDNTVEFQEASQRENIKSGEKLSVICGKIHKFFTDMKVSAYCDTTDSVQRGKDEDVTTKKALKEVNEKFGGMHLYEDETGKYIVGADSVPKKLGSGLDRMIDVFFNKRSKSISVRGELVTDPDTGNTHEEGAIYGHISEFDLSEYITEYSTMSLGEDFIVSIANIQSTQDTVNYQLQIIKEEQFNDTALDYNTVSIVDFPNETDVPIWGGNGSSQTTYRANFARYNPGTGKLYIITGSTATANAIGMYRI